MYVCFSFNHVYLTISRLVISYTYPQLSHMKTPCCSPVSPCSFQKDNGRGSPLALGEVGRLELPNRWACCAQRGASLAEADEGSDARGRAAEFEEFEDFFQVTGIWRLE